MRVTQVFIVSLVCLSVFAVTDQEWVKLNNQFFSLYQENKIDESLKIAFRSLELARDTLKNPYLERKSLLNLLYYYKALGNEQKAMLFLKKIFEIDDKIFLKNQMLDHEIKEFIYLAHIYRSQGKLGSLDPIYRNFLKSITGKNPHLVISFLNQLAYSYQCQGVFDEAENYYQMAMDIDEQIFSAHHSVFLTHFWRLVEIYQIQNNSESLEALYQRILQIQEKYLKPDDPKLRPILLSLSMYYDQREQYEKASTYYKRLLNIFEKVYGQTHNNVSELLLFLSFYYNRAGLHLEKAELETRLKDYDLQHMEALRHELFTFNLNGEAVKSPYLVMRILEVEKKPFPFVWKSLTEIGDDPSAWIFQFYSPVLKKNLFGQLNDRIMGFLLSGFEKKQLTISAENNVLTLKQNQMPNLSTRWVKMRHLLSGEIFWIQEGHISEDTVIGKEGAVREYFKKLYSRRVRLQILPSDLKEDAVCKLILSQE